MSEAATTGGETRGHRRSYDIALTAYRSLASVRAAGGGVVHDGYRSDDRQRLAADDRPRPSFLRDQPAMGGDRVRAHVWRVLAAWRPGRRSARTPPRPDGWARAVQ